MCLFGSVSATIRGIALKIHTSHSPHIRYKRTLRFDESVNRGSLLGEQCAFSAIYIGFPSRDFS